MSKHPPLTYVGERTLHAYTWKNQESTADWVEGNVKLSSEASPIQGQMQLKYTPHLREMFYDADKKGIYLYVAMASTQVAKTTYQLAITAKILDTKPAKILFAIPNDKDVADYVEDKVLPFMRGAESLVLKMNQFKESEKVRDKKSRLRVAGADVYFVGDTPSARRSKTVKYLMIDEIDLFEDNALVEFMNRTKSFEKYGRKIFVASSQKKSRGEAVKAYESCEVKKDWSTGCTKCGHYWYAGSKDLKFLSKKEYAKAKGIELDEIKYFEYKQTVLKDVYVECPKCSHHITNNEKEQNILNGHYKFVNIGAEKGNSIGYRMNALAMYFTTFETIVSQLLEILENGDFEDKRQFYVDMFNELIEPETTQTVTKNDILLLSNNLNEMEIPEDTFKLYLTVDTQKNGFWFKVTAVEYGMIFNTVYHGFVESFEELEHLLGYPYKSPSGKTFGIDKMLIDRMGIKERTVEVDAWLEDLIVSQGLDGIVYPSMGIQNDSGGRLWYYTTITKDITTGTHKKTPIQAVKLNNTFLKNELQNLIDRSIGKIKAEEEYISAKNRLYFINQDIVSYSVEKEKSLPTDYERQMTSETYNYKIDKVTGKVSTIKTWEKIYNSVDNHLWDCSVQAVACALMDNVSLAQKPSNEDFDNALGLLGL